MPATKQRLCACDCGLPIVGGNRNRRFVNSTHAMRVYQREHRVSRSPGPRVESCGCGCGAQLTGTRRKAYLNVAHRMRALRGRQREASRTPAA